MASLTRRIACPHLKMVFETVMMTGLILSWLRNGPCVQTSECGLIPAADKGKKRR
jgi:hypothetical protein